MIVVIKLHVSQLHHCDQIARNNYLNEVHDIGVKHPYHTCFREEQLIYSKQVQSVVHWTESRVNSSETTDLHPFNLGAECHGLVYIKNKFYFHVLHQ